MATRSPTFTFLTLDPTIQSIKEVSILVIGFGTEMIKVAQGWRAIQRREQRIGRGRTFEDDPGTFMTKYLRDGDRVSQGARD